MSMMTLKRLNRLYAARAIRLAGGDMDRAARMLGMGRATLYRWFPQSNMEPTLTKEQHQALRNLENAEGKYLVAFGWEMYDGKWTHPAVTHFRYRARDAVQLTRSNPLQFFRRA